MTRIEWLLSISLVVIFIVASLLDQYSPGWHDAIYPSQYIVMIILAWGWLQNGRNKTMP